jgi:glycosyltransferase involved in cell wall biosynthesis
MKKPRVSIGMPVFNGGSFIRKAIESILAQTFSDVELIISDNASDDETESICRELAAADARIRYYRNDENIGAARNYNKVYHLSRGEYFKWAAHDDECHPEFVSRCVDFLDRAPGSVVMVYPLAELIDEHGVTIETPLDRIETCDPRPHRRLVRVLWSLNMCDPIFGMIRSDCLRRTKLIGPFFGADYVLLGELAMLGEIRELNEVLFRLRAHSRRSMKANRGARARAAWYDPSAARKMFVMPGWERMVWEMLKSTRHPLIPAAEKVRCCLAIVGTHYCRRFRNAGGRVKARLKSFLGNSESEQRTALWVNRRS